VLALVTGEAAWVTCLTTGATVFVTGVAPFTEFVTGVAAGAGACEVVPVGGVVLDWTGVALELLDPEPGLLVLVPEEPPLEPWVPVAEGEDPEVAFEAAEVTGDVTLFTVDLSPERLADCPDWPGGGVSSVAACACRENSSMITKTPAATSASCTARRAMRRAIGCCMTAPHLAGMSGT
jgi:hypothetical protein